MKIHAKEMKAFLDSRVERYNSPEFIETDPVSIPRRFSVKQDIEISGFLAATIAWGQRVTIINNAGRLMEWMENAPYDFIRNFTEKDLIPFRKFTHRTFNGIDCEFFLWSLKNIYQNHHNLEHVFVAEFSENDPDTKNAIAGFRKKFFKLPHLKRTEKHVANPEKKASAKRLNMFLRWMVRQDAMGVDFGIWKKIRPTQLICPLDIHTAKVARKLGMLNRHINDWQAAVELTDKLKQFDASDPVKYDFALFGLGIFEGY
jgi:uncharacterized protein (TIGR02757 family)